MRNTKPIGIKRKVRRGCIILGMILFFSSLMSIYEFSSMNRYVTRVITDNVEGINSSRDLLETVEGYNLRLMYILDGNTEDFAEIDNADLARKFSEIRTRFDSPKEKAIADSIVFAYSAYMQVAREGNTVWKNEPSERRDWFFFRLQPVYRQLRDYVQKLTFVTQESLIENSRSMQDNFYRGMMPSTTALLLSIVLVLLLNYYLNHYLINPFLKVTKGILDYRKYGKPYSLKVDTDDEIDELNEAVSELIDLNAAYKNQLKKN